MKIVTRIEVVEVEGESYGEFFQMVSRRDSAPLWPLSSDNQEPEPIFARSIGIHGRKFIRDGELFVIGWHPGVEDMLSLPLECFENVERDMAEEYRKGYAAGVNHFWGSFKLTGKDTDYWFLPPFVFLAIAMYLM